MSEQAIPAWKRAGLKQDKQAVKKDKASYDPLKEGLKRAHESGETSKPAKPAKKPKLPKSERPAKTHELDQLAYLRQYAEDRDNWKFSKQKQNWILKHMFTDINDDKYSKPLVDYISGLQGSSRNWVIDDAKEVIKSWNDFMKEDVKSKEEADSNEQQDNEELPKKQNEQEESDEKENKEKTATSNNAGPDSNGGEEGQPPKKKAKNSPAPKEPVKKVPTEKMAKRAQEIVKVLTDEHVALELLD